MKISVVLDANTIHETSYLRSPSAQTLLDYLKKVDGELVLLGSVVEEVVANYERDLEAEINKANAAISNTKDKLFTKATLRVFPYVPKVSEQVEELKKLLRAPGKNVNVREIVDYSNLDILEIVRRGAKRIAPATKNGEELRDVIHWLATLEYCRSSKSSLAFISRDGAFWSNKVPREGILRDMEGLDLSIYHDIDSFVREHSISSLPLMAREAEKIFNHGEVERLGVRALGELLEGLEFNKSIWGFVEGNLKSLEFLSGTLFLVSKESEFVEATFGLKIATLVEVFEKDESRPEGWISIADALSGTQPSKEVKERKLARRMNFMSAIEADLSARRESGTVTGVSLERIRIKKFDPDDKDTK